MPESAPTTNWPDLAIGLYDRLTGRNAEISYEFSDMHVKIPSGTGAKAEQAEWVFSGTVNIRTRDLSNSPKLTTVGRLIGTIDGRPMTITADGTETTLHVSSVRSLVALRRSQAALRNVLSDVLSRSGLTFRLKVGKLPAFNVRPGV